LVYVNIK